MKQSLLASWCETIASTATGFAISLGLQYLVCWYYSLTLVLHDNLAIIGLFTVASLVRGIAWRRLMERLHVRDPLSPAMLAIAAERRRQQETEGFHAAHDDTHPSGDLALAGICYIRKAIDPAWTSSVAAPLLWPWEPRWWKPQGFWRDMVRGVALIVAEMDRSLRNRKRKPPVTVSESPARTEAT